MVFNNGTSNLGYIGTIDNKATLQLGENNNTDRITIQSDSITIVKDSTTSQGYTGTINGAKFVNGICIGTA